MEELEEETVPEDDAELTLSKVDEEFVVSVQPSCLQPCLWSAFPWLTLLLWFSGMCFVSQCSAILSP